MQDNLLTKNDLESFSPSFHVIPPVSFRSPTLKKRKCSDNWSPNWNLTNIRATGSKFSVYSLLRPTHQAALTERKLLKQPKNVYATELNPLAHRSSMDNEGGFHPNLLPRKQRSCCLTEMQAWVGKAKKKESPVLSEKNETRREIKSMGNIHAKKQRVRLFNKIERSKETEKSTGHHEESIGKFEESRGLNEEAWRKRKESSQRRFLKEKTQGNLFSLGGSEIYSSHQVEAFHPKTVYCSKEGTMILEEQIGLAIGKEESQSIKKLKNRLMILEKSPKIKKMSKVSKEKTQEQVMIESSGPLKLSEFLQNKGKHARRSTLLRRHHHEAEAMSRVSFALPIVSEKKSAVVRKAISKMAETLILKKFDQKHRPATKQEGLQKRGTPISTNSQESPESKSSGELIQERRNRNFFPESGNDKGAQRLIRNFHSNMTNYNIHLKRLKGFLNEIYLTANEADNDQVLDEAVISDKFLKSQRENFRKKDFAKFKLDFDKITTENIKSLELLNKKLECVLVNRRSQGIARATDDVMRKISKISGIRDQMRLSHGNPLENYKISFENGFKIVDAIRDFENSYGKINLVTKNSKKLQASLNQAYENVNEYLYLKDTEL